MKLRASLATLVLVIACAACRLDPAPLHKAVMSDAFAALIFALGGLLIVNLVVLWLSKPVWEDGEV